MVEYEFGTITADWWLLK